MSKFGGDAVLRMAPLSVGAAEKLGEMILEEFEPDALDDPRPLNIARWIEHRFDRRGIHVYPEDEDLFPVDVEAFTDHENSTLSSRLIILREPIYDDLMLGGSRLASAKLTLLHELSHAVLHIPQILRCRGKPIEATLLMPLSSRGVPDDSNSEMQAWRLAGSIAIPRRALLKLNSLDPRVVAEMFGTTASFAEDHLRTLGLIKQVRSSGPAGAKKGGSRV